MKKILLFAVLGPALLSLSGCNWIFPPAPKEDVVTDQATDDATAASDAPSDEPNAPGTGTPSGDGHGNGQGGGIDRPAQPTQK